MAKVPLEKIVLGYEKKKCARFSMPINTVFRPFAFSTAYTRRGNTMSCIDNAFLPPAPSSRLNHGVKLNGLPETATPTVFGGDNNQTNISPLCRIDRSLASIEFRHRQEPNTACPIIPSVAKPALCKVSRLQSIREHVRFYFRAYAGSNVKISTRLGFTEPLVR
jgi:hypothetical protein